MTAKTNSTQAAHTEDMNVARVDSKRSARGTSPFEQPGFLSVLPATPVLLEGEKVRAENAETKRTHCRRSYDGG